MKDFIFTFQLILSTVWFQRLHCSVLLLFCFLTQETDCFRAVVNYRLLVRNASQSLLHHKEVRGTHPDLHNELLFFFANASQLQCVRLRATKPPQACKVLALPLKACYHRELPQRPELTGNQPPPLPQRYRSVLVF